MGAKMMYNRNSKHEREQNRGRKQARLLYPVLSPCEGCGVEAKHRHHVDHNCLNNARSNVRFLCVKCHLKEHPEVSHAGGKASGKMTGAFQLAKTHCPHGHPYSGDNLYIRPNGDRFCKKCHRDRGRLRYQNDPVVRETEKERRIVSYQAMIADPKAHAAEKKRAREYARERFQSNPALRAAKNERNRLRNRALMADPAKRAAENERKRIGYQARKAAKMSIK
jgi:hypothetical protein